MSEDTLSIIKKLITDDQISEEGNVKIKREQTTIAKLFEEKKISKKGFKLTSIFNAFQGVTTGGEGSTEIFGTIPEDVEESNKLVYRNIMGRNIYPNEIVWDNEFCVYPYILRNDNLIPAFNYKDIDALDFSINIDSSEAGMDNSEKILYRMAKNIIKFPRIAEYLFSHYGALSNRRFEEKTMREYNKEWYEYHRKRTSSIFFTPKIVCRRLMKEPSFAIDNIGYLPKDSVVCFTPKKEFNNLLIELENKLARKVSILNGYSYVLSYLNSTWFAEILEAKRAKKRGGYPRIGERMLNSVVIPNPKDNSKEDVENRIQIDN